MAKRRKKKKARKKVNKDPDILFKNYGQDDIKYQKLNKKVKSLYNQIGLSTEKLKFIETPSNEVKMSAVVLKIAEPFLKRYWGDKKRIQGIINIAVLFWNISLLPKQDQDYFQEKIVDELVPEKSSAEDVAAIVEFTDTLMNRKRKYYPDLKVHIMRHELIISGNDLTLNVSSVPVEPKDNTETDHL